MNFKVLTLTTLIVSTSMQFNYGAMTPESSSAQSTPSPLGKTPIPPSEPRTSPLVSPLASPPASPLSERGGILNLNTLFSAAGRTGGVQSGAGYDDIDDDISVRRTVLTTTPVLGTTPSETTILEETIDEFGEDDEGVPANPEEIVALIGVHRAIKSSGQNEAKKE